MICFKSNLYIDSEVQILPTKHPERMEGCFKSLFLYRTFKKIKQWKNRGYLCFLFGKKYKSKVSNSKTSKVWFAISSDLLTFTHVDLTVWFLSQQAMTFDHNLTNLTLFLSIDLEKNWDFNQIKFKISNVTPSGCKDKIQIT